MRAAEDEQRPPPPNGVRTWQAIAAVALVVAVAGWATVAVLALRPAPPTVAVLASPTDAPFPSDEPFPSEDPSFEPPVESHEVPDLETLLPAELNGTALSRESWTGSTILGDDAWSSAVTAFLTGAGKTAADLQASQAYDPAGGVDLSAGAFRVAGIDGPKLLEQIIAAWKNGDYPDLKTAQTTVGGFAVTTGDFGEGTISAYWYVRDGVVFDIETGDQAIAEAVLKALPPSGGPTSPASPTPS